MLRRLFFLLPDNASATRLVIELRRYGIDHGHIHAIAQHRDFLRGLPMATSRQNRDVIWRVEQVLWTSLLALFAVALFGLVVAWSESSGWGIVAAVAVMIVSFAVGSTFVFRVPDAHLDEFRAALRHGENLLMIDVPRQRVASIENLVSRSHPEATPGGTGWTLDAFGV